MIERSRPTIKNCLLPLGLVGAVYLGSRLGKIIYDLSKHPRLNSVQHPSFVSSEKDEAFDELVRAEALILLNKNKRTGHINGREYVYEPPSEKYIQDWYWDRAHTAVIGSYLDPSLAKETLLTQAAIFDKLGSHGSQIVYFNHAGNLVERKLFNRLRGKEGVDQLTQIPLCGLALEIYVKKTGDWETVKQVLPLFDKHYQYIIDHRYVYKGVDLPVVIHPYESLDSLPSVDLMYQRKLNNKLLFGALAQGTLRKARQLNFDAKEITYAQEYSCFDVAFCAFCIRSYNSLAYLYEKLGNSEKAQYWQERADKSSIDLIGTCFDEENGYFYSRRANGKGELLKVDTAAGLLPLLNKFELHSDIPLLVIRRLLLYSNFLKDDYFIWTVFQNEKEFFQEEVDPLWRGPGCSIFEFYTGLGFMENGQTDLARKLWEGQQKRLVNRFKSGHPFPEFFRPDKTFNDPYMWGILSACNPADLYQN
ncbi:hypothetical protein HYT02_05370 [Candidatus Gottesmanbacteria bacterium]|nr:hypothetical protein [Candidatus Gottesmanbacteria bacterium]